MPRTSLLAGCVAGVLWPTSALARQLGTGAAPEISLIRIGLALLVCIALAIGAAVGLRRWKVGGRPLGLGALASRLKPAGRIELIEVRRISLHAELCLLSCHEREFLVVCGPSGIQLLSERDGLVGKASEGGN